MKFVFFVEGQTEKEVLANFISRWLTPRIISPVRISVVGFRGFGEYLSNIKDRADLYLSGKENNEIIAVVGLIDLYGPEIFPAQMSATEKAAWGKAELEKRVNHTKFRQYFAVHETEAWLLADDKVLPREVRTLLPSKCKKPESVNMSEPPSKLLDRLYRRGLNRGYRKTVDGSNLFLKCAPKTVASKCPHFQVLLSELEQLARGALQKNN